jgi:hypothetical protein
MGHSSDCFRANGVGRDTFPTLAYSKRCGTVPTTTARTQTLTRVSIDYGHKKEHGTQRIKQEQASWETMVTRGVER